MDEQEQQHSNPPEIALDDGNKRRSSRRRGRRRRGASEVTTAPAQETAAVEVDAQEPESEPEFEPERPRTGNAAKPKRRNAPRRTALPDITGPAEVVRSGAPRIAPLQPTRLRVIDPTDTSEPIIGCPMLTRTRIGIPFRGGQRVARCSVGWAVHDEDEVLLCMHTPTAAQCWKEHPEYLEPLLEKLRPVIEAELAASEG